MGTLAWGFSIGIQILIARRLGEKRLERIGIIFQHGLRLVLILGILLVATLSVITNPILTQVITSPNVLASAIEYMDYRFVGIFFVCINYLFRYFYIGLSQTKAITQSTILMAIVNVALNYALIFGNWGFPEMGIGGAALASVIAEATALCYFVAYTLIKVPLDKYELNKKHKLEPWLIKTIFKLSLPTMLQKMIAFGSWFMFFVFVEQMGEMPIAISSVLRSVSMLLGIPVFAFGATASTIVSRLIGAGRANEVRPTLIKISLMSIALLLPILAFCFAFPTQVLSIYSNNTDILNASVNALYVLCAAVSISSISWVYFDAISGTGSTSHALLVEFIVVTFYIVAIWLFTKVVNLGVEGAWATEIVYYVVMTTLSVLYMRYYSWQKKKL